MIDVFNDKIRCFSNNTTPSNYTHNVTPDNYTHNTTNNYNF